MQPAWPRQSHAGPRGPELPANRRAEPAMSHHSAIHLGTLFPTGQSDTRKSLSRKLHSVNCTAFSWINLWLDLFKKKKVSIKINWNHCSFRCSYLHDKMFKFQRVGGANASRSAEHGMSCWAKSQLCFRAVSGLPFSFGPQWLSQAETLWVFSPLRCP